MTSTGRILVVDDSDPHRYVMTRWLRRAGYEVEEAATGSEALELASPDLDVVVLDVNLPDTTGFEVCSTLKSRASTASVPVMHVSATAIDVRSRAEGLDRGADAYLVEPLEREEFLATVRALARAHSARRSARAFTERLVALAAVGVPVNAATSVLRLLEAAAGGASEVFGAPAVVAAASGGGAITRVLTAGPGVPPLTDVGETGLLVGCDEGPRRVPPSEEPQPWRRLREQAGLAPLDWWALPVCDRDGLTVGGLAIGLADGAETLGASDVALAAQLAESIGVALSNVRAYAQEHQVASTLQRALLPAALPTPPGLALAARYIASSEHVSVGGDFYDAFPLASGDLAVVIGDVQGHSLAAATVMAELRFSLRAYLHEGHDGPTAFALLNDLLLRHHPESTATTVLVVVEASGRRMHVTNAGHLPPLLVTADDAVFLEGGGALFGLALPPPSPRAVDLPEEWSLVLATDGLVETRTRSVGEGLEQLRSLGRWSFSLSPERTCDLLLDRFLPPVVEDDVAVVVVSRRSDGEDGL